jgi:hypothetical protein
MSANWQAGDKAVCVDDKVSPSWNPEKTIDFDVPIKGRIYLVTDYRDIVFADGAFPRLFLAGISIEMVGVGSCGFHPDRFRRVVAACDRIENEVAISTDKPTP